MYLSIVCILLGDRFNIFPFEQKNHFTDVKFLTRCRAQNVFGQIDHTVANIDTPVHISLNVISTYLKNDTMWLTACDSLREIADSREFSTARTYGYGYG